jgi:hypothetical protein
MTARHRRRRERAAAHVIIAIALAAALAPVPAAAWDDEPGERLGLPSIGASNAGALFGFINKDRLTHARSLSFGYASTSGPSRDYGAATYADFFSYRLRDNLSMDLALRYSFSSSFRSAHEERGQFSVLPSFALEYHPGQNTLLRFSYERLGPGAPFLAGWRTAP